MSKKLTALFLVILQLVSVFSAFVVTAETGSLTATEYLQLDNDKTMWLVLKTGDPGDGHVYTYQGQSMFWSDKYDAYTFLVITDGELTLSADDVAAVQGVATHIEYNGDVNKTGKIDANDAQIVYNIYTSYYSSFTTLTMEKFLRADMNGDGTVSITDAQAVVANIGKQTVDTHTCDVNSLVHVAAVDPTCTAVGNIEYWYCPEVTCGKKYTAADGTGEVAIVLLSATGIHTGGTATCTTQAVCTVCGTSYGDLLDHDSNDLSHDSNDHWTVCSVCGGNAGVHEAHHGGTATCTAKAECIICGVTYGSLAAHDSNKINYNDDGHWTYCSICGGNAGTVTAHTGTTDCTVCSWTTTAASSGLTVNGTALTSYKIYTDTASKDVAISLRKSTTYVLNKSLTVATTTPSGNAIVVKIDSSLAANQWKYYCESGTVYIYGENLAALKTGYMYFISKYILPEEPEAIVDGIYATGTAAEEELVSFNLPTSYEAFGVGDGTYTADNIWNTFLKAKEELPDEVTVLDHYDPADYPLSSAMQIFVAPDGDDNNDGSIDHPVATVAKAYNLLNARGIYGGVIWLREGLYNQYVEIDSYTGIPDSPLFISAYNGENVTWSGAYDFSGSAFSDLTESDPLWSRVQERVRDRVVVADLAALGIDISELTQISRTLRPILFVDGNKQTIARYPNGEGVIRQSSFLDESGSTSSNRPLTLIFDTDVVDFSQWQLTDNMWLEGSLYHAWGFDICRIAKIDTENNSVTTVDYKQWHTHGGIGYSNQFYFFNFIEVLDAPGEWYLDRDTSRFYYIPADNFTEDSVFKLIGCDTRTATVSVKNSSYIVIRDFDFVYMNGYGVYTDGCDSIIVDSCYFENSTTNSAFLMGGKRCGVIYSEIYNLGGQIAASYTAQYTLTPTNNFFQNNYCHATAERGIGISSGVGNVFSHNRMNDVVITMGGQNNETIVEYNEITGGRIGKSDSGYIYFAASNFTIRGNHVRYNFFHDMEHSYSGIYFDMRASGNYAYGNIVEGNKKFEQMRLVCQVGDNVVYNNILLHARDGVTGNLTEWSTDTTGVDITFYQSYNSTFDNMGDAYKARYPMYVDMVTRMRQILSDNGGSTTLTTVTDDTKLFYAGGYQWIKNNIIIDCTTPYIQDETYLANYVFGEETNLVSDGDIGFVDYDNDNFRLTTAGLAAVKAQIPDWEELPYDKMGIQHTCSSTFLTEFEAIDPTCGTEGQKHHYRCACGIYYQNADATGVISAPSTLVIAATGDHTDEYLNCMNCGADLNNLDGQYSYKIIKKGTPALDGQMDTMYYNGVIARLSTLPANAKKEIHENSFISFLHDDEYLYIYAKLYDLEPFKVPTETVTIDNGYAVASSFCLIVAGTTDSVERGFYIGPGFDYIAGTDNFDTSAVDYVISLDNGAPYVDSNGSYYQIEIRLNKSEFNITDQLKLTKLKSVTNQGTAGWDWLRYQLISDSAA